MKIWSSRTKIILAGFGIAVSVTWLWAQDNTQNGKNLIFIPYSINKEKHQTYDSEKADYYINTLQIGLQNDGNLARRLKAARILGRYQSKRAIHLLHKTLATTFHPSLRTQCIDALARINDPLSAMFIENALQDKNIGGTYKGEPFVAEGIKKHEEYKKKYPKRNPSRAGEPKKDNPNIVFEYPDVQEYLQVKRTASWALGIMKRHRSIIVLAGALDDKDDEVRINAAYSLGEIANPGAVISKKPSTVEDHIEDIIKKFNDENLPDKVRIAIAYPMLKLRKNERKGYYFIAKSLLSENDFTRALAAKILARLHDIRGLSPLEDSLARERNAWVANEMREGIKQIKMFNQSYR